MDTKRLNKDHDLLHQLFKSDNPQSDLPIVLNGLYGSSHQWYVESPTLTKNQIKLMHDTLVTQLGYNDTPIEILDSKETPLNMPPKEDVWDTVLIKSPYVGELTKRDIFRYYSDPKIRKEVLKNVKDKPLMIRQTLDTNTSFLKRKDVSIDRDMSDVFNKKDIQYHIERRATEFHPVFSGKVPRAVVDIDPGDKVPFDKVKLIAKTVADVLERQSFVTDTSFQFSGNKGFYVWADLQNPLELDELRMKLTSTLSIFDDIKGTPITLGVKSSPNEVRLDLSPIKELGPIKSAYSLDSRTGLVSIPVEDLSSFVPEHASITNVLGYDPRSAYSFKYETNV